VSFELTVQIDPYAVLGVDQAASLQVIRDAYRQKAKQHHPDAGGEAWAFRIVARAYEILSTERISQATQAEFRARPSQPAGGPAGDARPGPAAGAPRGGQAEMDGVRPGLRDPVGDPARVVDVEKLWIRYEIDHVWLLHEGSSEERFLSCCLNISWPDPSLASRAESLPDAEEILKKLTEAYDVVRRKIKVTGAWSEVQDHQFQGWLSYAGTQLAWNAFNKLHQELNDRGLSVKQWTRDMIIPRSWR
jgi:hypothetical protein